MGIVGLHRDAQRGRQLLEESIRLNRRYQQTEVQLLRMFTRKLRQPLLRVGGDSFAMSYRMGNDFGTGIRYVLLRPTIASFRVNWTSKRKTIEPTSVDVFLRHQWRPSYRLDISSVGFGAVADLLADLLASREPIRSDIVLLVDGGDDMLADSQQTPITTSPQYAQAIADAKKDQGKAAADLLSRGLSPHEITAIASIPTAVSEQLLLQHPETFGTIVNPRKRVVRIIPVIAGRADKQETLAAKMNDRVVETWMNDNEGRVESALAPLSSTLKRLSTSRDYSLLVGGIDENGLRRKFEDIVAKLDGVVAVDCTEMQPRDIVALAWKWKDEDGKTLVLLGAERVAEDPVSRSTVMSMCQNKDSRVVRAGGKTADYGDSPDAEIAKAVAEGKPYPSSFIFKSNVVLVSDRRPSWAGNSIVNPAVDVVLPPATVFAAIKDTMANLVVGAADQSVKQECLDYLQRLSSRLQGFTVSMWETAVVCRLTSQANFEKLFMTHVSGQFGGVAEF